jgi:hypothetical protein
MKTLIRKKLLRVTADFKEYLEIFSNGDIEFASYERKDKAEDVI